MRENNDQPPGHLAAGRRGEEETAAYLRGLGLEVLARNWRPPLSVGAGASVLELDLVAREGETLLFVEVKTRVYAPGTGFNPQDAFTVSKRRKLCKAASWYMELSGQWGRPCRFDLICVILYPNAAPKLEHFKNVLSFQDFGRGTPGGVHSSWQPW